MYKPVHLYKQSKEQTYLQGKAIKETTDKFYPESDEEEEEEDTNEESDDSSSSSESGMFSCRLCLSLLPDFVLLISSLPGHFLSPPFQFLLLHTIYFLITLLDTDAISFLPLPSYRAS